MTPITKTFMYGHHTVTLETGVVARQASGAVLAHMGDTTILATVVAKEESGESNSFFPLSVHYQEKTYAAGKIPGGFFKREGRPTEKETLTSRLIDRPIRPLFPEGFKNEVQVVVSVMSLDKDISPDIVSMLGVSAALCLSGAPFNGPIGAARVGYKDGDYVLNPSETELTESELDLVVAGTENAVLMVESEAKGLPEDVMLGAVVFGHEQMQTAITAINEFAKEAGKEKWHWQAPEENIELSAQVAECALSSLVDAYKIADKQERNKQLAELRTKIATDMVESAITNKTIEAEQTDSFQGEVSAEISKLEKKIVRRTLLDQGIRIDGRDTKTVRPINIQVGFLPRVHGSALFTRGETQAIVTTTVGTEKDAQIIDALEGERKDAFMLHYNFPPYCVGETGMVGGPKRREIGHGNLAKRAVKSLLPEGGDFPYVLRVVSEITESNGSSSMATVCGTSLALMDAGIPVKAPVAGIAMGLIKEEDGFVVLSDILGDEDHLGDMDFKVAGTEQGVTALQMDIKIDGITKEIMKTALDQAKDGRLHILGEMNKVLSKTREEMSDHAPRITTFKIDPDKIRDVIGKGGVTIRSLIEETGVSIDISDDGVVKIGSSDSEASADAIQRIKDITADAEVGQTYEGKVTRILDFGAIVNFLPNKDGLVHISEISQERIANVKDVLSEGQTVTVKIIEIDKAGRVRLSMKRVGEE